MVGRNFGDPASGAWAGVQCLPASELPAEPRTISRHARRLRGNAAVLRNGVCAGTIESKRGRAEVTPIPRRTERRERCFFVINILCLWFDVAAPYLRVIDCWSCRTSSRFQLQRACDQPSSQDSAVCCIARWSPSCPPSCRPQFSPGCNLDRGAQRENGRLAWLHRAPKAPSPFPSLPSR